VTSATTKALHRTKVQHYEYVEIPRTWIKSHPFNPRTISEYARRKLKQILENHGLVETPVWNKRSGNLVGGHQRLSIVDDIEGTDQYTIGVAQIDVDKRREKELMVALNNAQAQGGFDADKFFEMLKSEDAPTLEGMGFTKSDLEIEFGAVPEIDEAFGEAAEAAEAVITDVEAIKAARKAGLETSRASAEDDADYFLMIVFPTAATKEKFLNSLGRPGDLRYMESSEMELYLAEKHQLQLRAAMEEDERERAEEKAEIAAKKAAIKAGAAPDAE
jgi:hypothetical protein